MKWDGTVWVITETPVPNYESELLAVSCTSATFCMAVGIFDSGRSLNLLWNGANWSLHQTENGWRTSPSTSVACISEVDCVGTTSFVETFAWQGSTWSMIQRQSEASTEALNGISCMSSTSCFAVGSRQVTSPDITIGSYTQTFIQLLVPKPATSLGLSAKQKQTVSSSKLTKAAGLAVPKGAKVTLSVSSKYKKVCKVVGTAVKTVSKGTCWVKVVVTTKSKKKTSKTVTINIK
jgi:hypothetical protein